MERPVPVATVENDWGFHITPGPLWRAIDTLAIASAHTPLGWPIVMIALALGAVVIGWRDAPSSLLSARGTGLAGLALPLALSSFLYGMSYLTFSVASELRYHLWTSLAALLATVLTLSGARSIGRRALMIAYAPTVLVLILCLAFRL